MGEFTRKQRCMIELSFVFSGSCVKIWNCHLPTDQLTWVGAWDATKMLPIRSERLQHSGRNAPAQFQCQHHADDFLLILSNWQERGNYCETNLKCCPESVTRWWRTTKRLFWLLFALSGSFGYILTWPTCPREKVTMPGYTLARPPSQDIYAAIFSTSAISLS